jgi:hypothetical protein
MEADLIITSKTQSAETIEKLLEEDGFSGVKTEVASDQAEPAGGKTKRAPSEATAPVPAEEETPLETDNNASIPAEETAKSSAAPPVETPAAPTPAPEVTEAAIPVQKPKPKWEDFLDQEDPQTAMTEAIADWTFDERERQRLIQEQENRKAKIEADTRAAAEHEMQAERERWGSKITTAKSKHQDFDAVINGAEQHLQRNLGPQAAPALTIAVQDSEKAGEVFYYLAAHPDELERLAKATRFSAGASLREQRLKMATAYDEIRKLETQLADTATPRASAPPPRRQPPKPTPVTPVGSHGGSHSVNLNDPKQVAAMDFDEYRRHRGMR